MSLFRFEEANLTGTTINYFVHCRRQCWLFAHKINLEDNSELVKVGRALHEAKESREVEIDNIKVDKISGEYLTEIKKSDSDLNAGRFQILFYLQKLKRKGVLKKGRLEVVEKKTGERKTHIYELDEASEKELEAMKIAALTLLNGDKIPPPEKNGKCGKCAYFSYCYI